MYSNLPKVILHEHIEGTVTPQMAKRLAKKHNVILPDTFIFEEGQYDKKQYPQGRYCYDESNFNEFIITYDVVASLVKDPEDYYLIIKDFLTRNSEQGLIYCEIITSAFHLCYTNEKENGGFDSDKYNLIMEQVEKAIEEIKSEFGTEVRLQACGVRHLELKYINESVDFIKDNPRKLLTGFNIAGNEMAGSFSDFHYAHNVVSDIPLQKSYHAGEICGPENIDSALEFGAVRIGHGIASIKDNELITKLIEKNILLEIALTSNRILVPELKQSLINHPLKKLYDKGVRVSINTDDAGLFGTDIQKEYQIAESVFDFSRIELLDVSLCAIEVAFVENEVKKSLIDNVYNCFTSDDWHDLKNMIERPLSVALKKRLSDRYKKKNMYEVI